MSAEQTDIPEPQANIFISYAHRDYGWVSELRDHLGGLIHRGLVQIFSDQDLKAGDEWEARIHQHIRNSDIIIPLISKSFLGSKYCSVVEVDMALEQHEKRQAHIVPIVVDHCDWEALAFSQFDMRPVADDKSISPLSDWKNPNLAFRVIAKDIRLLVEVVSKTQKNGTKSNEQPIPGDAGSPDTIPVPVSHRRLEGALPCPSIGRVNARVLFRGTAPGTFTSRIDARINGLTSNLPGATPSVIDMIHHISFGTRSSPFISLTRSYAVAHAYAMSGRVLPSAADPGFIYEIDVSDQTDLFLIDPVVDLAKLLSASPEAYHSGDQDLFRRIVDPVSFGRDLMVPVAGPRGEIRPHFSVELETMARVLRDAYVLAVGSIAAKYVIARHEVF